MTSDSKTAWTPEDTEVMATIAAYQRGLSYEAVARELGTSAWRVHSIMKRHAPGAIRSRVQQIQARPKPLAAEEGLTLSALGLYAIGPCADCGVPLVSPTRERGQACGLCRLYKPGVGAGLYAGRAA